MGHLPTETKLDKVEREMNSFERSTLRWTRATFLILGVTCGFIGFQWYEMRSGSRDTHDLAVAAKAQADKMTNVSTAADEIRQAAQDMVVQDRRIADNAKDSLNASNRQSGAALEASNKQSKASLDATIESSHSDQRAWVVPSAFSLSEEPSLNKDFTIRISVLNTGKTPALDDIDQSVLLFWNSDPPLIPFAVPQSASKAIIAPGLTGNSFTSDPMKLTTADQMDAYTKKTSNIYVEAIIRYNDIFGNPHWTRICAFHVYGTPLDTFRFCQNGNEVDQEHGQHRN